jgi:hypothetical protein
MKVSSLILFFGFIMTPAFAIAQDRTMKTIWTIEASTSTPTAQKLKPRDYIFRQRLLPTAIAQIDGIALGVSIEGVTNETQLVEIQSAGAAVFCDPVVRAQKLIGHAQPCFIDGDNDGRFEGLFMTTSVTEGLLNIQGNRPKKPRAILPVTYKKLASDQFKRQLFFGIQYRGNANVLSNHVFEYNFGDLNTVEKDSITNRFIVKRNELPMKMDIMGGSFTLMSESADGIVVRIDKTLPSQPFGVLQTTTYRFY